MKAIKIEGVVYVWNEADNAYLTPDGTRELSSHFLAVALANGEVKEAKATVVILNNRGTVFARRGEDGAYYEDGAGLVLSEYALILDAIAAGEFTMSKEYE